MKSERAKNYATALRESSNIPVDVGDKTEMELPEYANHDLIRRAQQVFFDNLFSVFYSMYIGLLAILAIPSILNVLVHTKKSSSDETAYKRYIQTILHTLIWFRHDLRPGTKAWKSLEAITKFHFSANRSAKVASVGIISQMDMVITQYGFMGFTVMNQKQTGMQGNTEDLTAYCHFWRVLGNLIGIHDEFNLCGETLEETLERLEVVRSEFLLPALQFPPKDFEKMTGHIVGGLWCFNPSDPYEVLMFNINRFIGVPNNYYHESEMTENCDKSKSEYYKLSVFNRFSLWFSIFIHEYILQFSFCRWWLNKQTLFHEFLITYFPFLAIYKFGWKKAYISISMNENEL